MSYNDEFYDVIRQGCIDSAAVVVPLVRELIEPATVIDVGCGEGHWGAAFADLGCDVVGVDGDYVGDRRIAFQAVDLTVPGRVGQLREGRRPWDLAVCLEVAEHLPPERAPQFIDELCMIAPVVLFSAAIPGQGGTGHVNEQWPRYWADLFERVAFKVSGALRWQLWEDERIENWYRQNLLVATTWPDRLPALFDTPLAEPLPLVHPVLFEARR